jgi:hypothetical protein
MWRGPNARHDDVWRSGDRGPIILKLETIRRWVVSLTSRLRYSQGTSYCYSLYRRLGKFWSHCGHLLIKETNSEHNSSVFQSLPSCCTDRAIQTPVWTQELHNLPSSTNVIYVIIWRVKWGEVRYKTDCTYNVTWVAFVQLLLQWKCKMRFTLWACVCSLSYSAFKAHVAYFTVICGLSGCTIFVTLSQIKKYLRKKKVIEHKTLVWHSLQLLWNISHSKKNSARQYDKHTVW